MKVVARTRVRVEKTACVWVCRFEKSMQGKSKCRFYLVGGVLVDQGLLLFASSLSSSRCLWVLRFEKGRAGQEMSRYQIIGVLWLPYAVTLSQCQNIDGLVEICGVLTPLLA